MNPAAYTDELEKIAIGPRMMQRGLDAAERRMAALRQSELPASFQQRMRQRLNAQTQRISRLADAKSLRNDQAVASLRPTLQNVPKARALEQNTNNVLGFRNDLEKKVHRFNTYG